MKWRRVTKTSPRPGKKVLVWNGCVVTEAERLPKRQWWNGRLQWATGGGYTQGVRHWMPMPTPPNKARWGIRPHTLGQWLEHLGISDKEFDKLRRDMDRRPLSEKP